MKNNLVYQFNFTDAQNCNVKTPRDESVGSIKDCVINTETNQVEYVVLKVNEGFLNLGSKLLALPLESFHFDTQQDNVIIVKESIETLKNAPGFDEGEWPTGPQSDFIHSMRTYYSVEPRSLYGRYDHQNQIFFDEEDRFDLESETIREPEYGDGFLERNHRGHRQSEVRRGGDPLL